MQWAYYFYPRSPCGERPIAVYPVFPMSVFLSTLSLRRATAIIYQAVPISVISIHALLAESDLHTGSSWAAWFPFLSTLSLRRATHTGGTGNNRGCDFYPRSPCGERPLADCTKIYAVGDFYPRSPCGERRSRLSRLSRLPAFLSTLSLRRATTIATASKNRYLHFYPRSPCGERHRHKTGRVHDGHFYPRSPCGERPSQGGLFQCQDTISIHALLAESDQPRSRKTGRLPPFLSTLSLRRATATLT